MTSEDKIKVLSEAESELIGMVPDAIQALKSALVKPGRNAQTQIKVALSVFDRVGLPAVSKSVIANGPGESLKHSHEIVVRFVDTSDSGLPK